MSALLFGAGVGSFADLTAILPFLRFVGILTVGGVLLIYKASRGG
jgi:hypothetical protein